MFFIAGLPRSRTAWFSVFFGLNGVECLHDPQNGCKTLAEYIGKIKDKAESGTGFYFTRPDAYYPDRKIVFIKQSGKKLEKTKAIMPMADIIQRTLGEVAGLTVDFYEIDDRIDEVCEFVGVKPSVYIPEMVITTKAEQDVLAAESLLYGR